MRTTIVFMLLFWTTLTGAVMAADQPTHDETWMSVRLGGRQIGHLLIEHERDADHIVTTQTLSIVLNRNGKSIPVGTQSRSIESLEGEPLGFSASMQLSNVASTVDGSRDSDRHFRIDSQVGGSHQSRAMAWPDGALLADGLRRAMLAHAGKPGDRYALRIFDPASQLANVVQIEVVGDEHVSLPGGEEVLNHQRQTLHTPRGDQLIDLWLAADGSVRKGVLSMFGRQIDMQACDRACALAPVRDLDMFRAAMVLSPRPLPGNMRTGFMRYRIRVHGDVAQPFVETDEQKVTALGHGQWQVDVCVAQRGIQAPPTAADREANLWVQSNEPAVRELSALAVGNAQDDHEKMRLLRSFVSDYITEHGLDVGYASALEVVDNRQGDCTEYAILLTALARAQGIPARMVTGMVYADRYAGSSHLFLPHAWTQAWVDDRWQSYDAALRHFDNTHIALDTGDGEPWHFFGAAQVFAALSMEDARAYWELMTPPPPAPPGPPVTGGGR